MEYWKSRGYWAGVRTPFRRRLFLRTTAIATSNEHLSVLLDRSCRVVSIDDSFDRLMSPFSRVLAFEKCSHLGTISMVDGMLQFAG